MMHIGMPDFAEPTLLFLCEANSLTWLAEEIGARRDIDFTGASGVVLQRGLQLHIAPTAASGSLKRNGRSFAWAISPEEATRFANQLHELAKSKSAAHAYLDSSYSDVQVVVSLGEYLATEIFEPDLRPF